MLVLISSILVCLSFIPYIVQTIQGKVRPVRVSWGVWAITMWVSTLAQGRLHSAETYWFVFLDTLGVSLVFLLSFRYGIGGKSRSDLLCLCLSLISIVCWLLTKDARFGIYLNMLADGIAAIPLLLHALAKPHEENGWTFAVFAAGGILSLFSNSNWAFDVVIFPVYIIILNAVLALIVLRSNRKLL